MIASPYVERWLGPALWLVLVLPPARHALETSMTLQMLVQLPLLALAGWSLRPWLPRRVKLALQAWNHSGISGLLLASIVAMVWMLPRLMDASLESWWIEVMKFISVPLLIGLPLAISWPRAGFVVRGVLMLEVTATALRLGWLYLATPQRLCSNYLLSDQQQLGKLMVAIGVAISLVLVWKLMWGHIDVEAESDRNRPR